MSSCATTKIHSSISYLPSGYMLTSVVYIVHLPSTNFAIFWISFVYSFSGWYGFIKKINFFSFLIMHWPRSHIYSIVIKTSFYINLVNVYLYRIHSIYEHCFKATSNREKKYENKQIFLKYTRLSYCMNPSYRKTSTSMKHCLYNWYVYRRSE